MPLQLLTAGGAYDRSAIMKAAHARAQERAAYAIEHGYAKAYPYALALRHSLKAVWSDARVYREGFERRAAEAAALATNDRTALIIAELRHDRMCARMIDSLPAHLAAMADIDARAAALGVSL